MPQDPQNPKPRPNVYRDGATQKCDLERYPRKPSGAEVRSLETTAWLSAHRQGIQNGNAQSKKRGVQRNSEELLRRFLALFGKWFTAIRKWFEVDKVVRLWKEELQADQNWCASNTTRSARLPISANVIDDDKDSVHVGNSTPSECLCSRNQRSVCPSLTGFPQWVCNQSRRGRTPANQLVSDIFHQLKSHAG